MVPPQRNVSAVAAWYTDNLACRLRIMAGAGVPPTTGADSGGGRRRPPRGLVGAVEGGCIKVGGCIVAGAARLANGSTRRSSSSNGVCASEGWVVVGRERGDAMVLKKRGWYWGRMRKWRMSEDEDGDEKGDGRVPVVGSVFIKK